MDIFEIILIIIFLVIIFNYIINIETRYNNLNSNLEMKYNKYITSIIDIYQKIDDINDKYVKINKFKPLIDYLDENNIVIKNEYFQNLTMYKKGREHYVSFFKKYNYDEIITSGILKTIIIKNNDKYLINQTLIIPYINYYNNTYEYKFENYISLEDLNKVDYVFQN